MRLKKKSIKKITKKITQVNPPKPWPGSWEPRSRDEDNLVDFFKKKSDLTRQILDSGHEIKINP